MIKKTNFEISGNVVDVVSGKIFPGIVKVENGKIASITETKNADNNFILPGLIDAHIHIESSMLIPSEFARLAVIHGTVATVSDPHEIANVLGIDGVKYMIRNGKKVPFKFYFGAPSCVPATNFETAGATLGITEIEELLGMNEIKYMSEMMNFPGVLFEDSEVMSKIAIAKKHEKPIDGHAPGIKGEDAKKYIQSGITTDHECFTMEEALEKLKWGMKIQIREGSAAKNFDALIGLLESHPDHVLFCSDDKHPNDLVEGHINQLIKRALAKGYDPVRVLRCCTLNPVKHYRLDVGLLQPGDDADFILVDDLNNFGVLATYIQGEKAAECGKTFISSVEEMEPNFFKASKISLADIRVEADSNLVNCIRAFDGQLITEKVLHEAKKDDGNLVSNVEKDVLKIMVMNRYKKADPAVGFINNFGFKKGAIASTVAHDSHNIIAVGTSDEEIVRAVNLLVDSKGGISLINGCNEHVLPLPVAGLMAAKDGFLVAKAYDKMDMLAKDLGSKLNAPYMTLSFMALLVIPELKLSDKGLFDGKTFTFTSLLKN